ncbi:MAG TPA: hypothetical protein VNH64_03695 [Parvularculaceae bacterium]|nr:hypothetical protein [Parvularculaceae bacterium]
MADGAGGIFSKPKKRARIAYSGEEFGFGFRAIDAYAARVSHDYHGQIPDGGKSSHGQGSINFDPDGGVPLRSKDQALASLAAGNAEYAVVPFYSPHSGYDAETLNLLSNIPALGVDQVDAGDRFCLAVYEPQVLDLVHASHPGSGLSYLMKGRNAWAQRATWRQQAVDRGVDLLAEDHPHQRRDHHHETNIAGLSNVDRAGQMLLRDRVDVVFAGPEATRRCKAKLDGLRAAGVKVEETLEWVEPHREMARRVRDTLDKSRQTSTVFDPATGEAKFTSIMSAEAQTRPLYAVVLPFEVASRSPEFTIVDDNLEDTDTPKTRFLIVEKQGDPTLIDDTYALTRRRVNYWLARMLHVGRESVFLKLGLHQLAGLAIMAGASLVVLFDIARYLADIGAAPPAIEQYIGSSYFGWAGIALTIIPWAALWVFDYGRGLLAEIFKSLFSRPQSGVRVLLQFRGVGQTASLADVEWRLRYFGISFRTSRTRDDSAKNPADLLLDVEFDRRHFDWHPGLLKSIVQEILDAAFEPAMHGKVKVLAVMPFRSPELPAYKRRRWWLEGMRAGSEESQKKAEARLVLGYRALVQSMPAIAAFGLLIFATYKVGGVSNLIAILAKLFNR